MSKRSLSSDQTLQTAVAPLGFLGWVVFAAALAQALLLAAFLWPFLSGDGLSRHLGALLSGYFPSAAFLALALSAALLAMASALLRKAPLASSILLLASGGLIGLSSLTFGLSVGTGAGLIVTMGGAVLAFRRSRQGPNNSFKPNPLRGSA